MIAYMKPKSNQVRRIEELCRRPHLSFFQPLGKVAGLCTAKLPIIRPQFNQPLRSIFDDSHRIRRNRTLH